MNIFVVHQDPKTSAQQLCDKHVVKMILESAQMLCSAYPNGDAPYKRAFYNHPCTIWARESQENYEWLLDHAYAMCQEYTRRYSKVHKSIHAIEWCGKNQAKLELPKRFIVAIDSAAMRSGADSTDDYLQDWRHSEPQIISENLEREAEALCNELEQLYDKERLRDLVSKGGFENE